jgi:hypothetical protein
MNHWYLVASLPYLRFGEKPPVSRDAFLSACGGCLPDDEFAALRAVLENRKPVDGGVAGAWWNGEVQLRNAVARIRSRNRSADAARFIRPHEGFSVSIEKAVTDAFAQSNPLEQESELDRARWSLADELALTNPFGFPGILAFAVKLRIAERWAVLNDEGGQKRVEEFIEQATA